MDNLEPEGFGKVGRNMALIKQGGLISEISGKVGGIVFSRNRGGSFVRTFTVPANPRTSYQTAVRNALTGASTAWKDLTDAQRATWVAWAQENPVRNRMGEAIRLQGNAAFVELNARMVLMGNAPATAPPTASAPDPLLTLGGTFDIGAGDFELTYTTTPAPANMKVWVLGCLLLSDSINNVNSRLRHFYTSAAAAASPAAIETAFTARFGAPAVGNKVVFRAAMISNVDGQLSSFLETSGLVTTT